MFFNRHNFTIEDDTLLQCPVSVDPEILGKVLGRVCKLALEKNKGENEKGREVGGTLVKAGGEATKLFEPVESALNDITLAVEALVEPSAMPLVPELWDGIPEPGRMQRRPKGFTGVAFIADDALRTPLSSAVVLYPAAIDQCPRHR